MSLLSTKILVFENKNKSFAPQKDGKNYKNYFSFFKLKLCVGIFFLCGFFGANVYALNFSLPHTGNIVGEIKTSMVRSGEDFSDIAERYDVGYYEILEANPGVDPDNPAPNTVLLIPTQYILPPQLGQNIVVNVAEMRLYFQPKHSNKVYVYPIGIGQEGWVTPVGTFKIAQKTVNPKWVAPASVFKFRKTIGDPVERVIPPGPDNPLGHYAMRLNSPTYLIHGTNAPEGVGRRSSAGCIRLYPADIDQLFHMVPVGTQVVIINQPYKAGWLNGKLYFEAHMPLFEQRVRQGDDIAPAIGVLEAADPYNTAQVDWAEFAKIVREHLALPRNIERR